MLAPETLVKATLVTIAEPDDTWYRPYQMCAVCGELFEDASPAYTIGEYPPAYFHIACI